MLEVQKAHGGQAVAELLGDVDIIVPHLKLGVLFDAADGQFMVQRFVEPHFGMAFGNVIVNLGVKKFNIFGSPAANKLAVFVLAPANAQTGGNSFVFVAACSVSGHNHFQNGAVLKLTDDLVVNRCNFAKKFFRQNRGVREQR